MSERLLYIVPSLEFTGTAKQMALLAEQLSKRGLRVSVLSLSGPGPLQPALEQAGVCVKSCPRDLYHPLRNWQYVRQLVRDHDPAIVHTWDHTANLYGRLLAIAAGAPRIIASYRSVPSSWGLWQQQLDRRLARWTEACVVNGSAVRDACRPLGIPREKWNLIPSGVAPPRDVSVSEKSRRMSDWGIPEHAKLVGVIGTLLPVKRIKDLIWATDLLKNIRDDVYLLIIGDGPQRWRLERYRDQVRLGDRVRFLGGRFDVRPFVGALDFLWQASQCGGTPNSVLEAMAAGVTVVASDIPAHRELIRPNETGQLVGVGDRAGFARTTNHLLDDPQQVARLTSAAQQSVVRRFDLPTMVQQHLSLYRAA